MYYIGGNYQEFKSEDIFDVTAGDYLYMTSASTSLIICNVIVQEVLLNTNVVQNYVSSYNNNINSATDVVETSLTSGDVLVWNGSTNKWNNSAVSNPSSQNYFK